jgi:hypothetical protein
MAPLPDEPGQKVLVLCQFNLEFPFMGSGFSGKYVQDQSGAVNNLDPQCLFQISLLPWRQLVIKDYCVILGLIFEVD